MSELMIILMALKLFVIHRKDVAKSAVSFLQFFPPKEPKRPYNLSVGHTTAGTDGHLLL